MQRKLGKLLVLVMLIALFTGTTLAQEGYTIKVQSTGTVKVNPTQIKLWVGAQTQGQTAKEALATNNSIMEKLIPVFHKFTKPEFVKSSDFNIFQRERWDNEIQQSVPDGFNARHVFEIQIVDLSQVATFLDEVTSAGANVIYGLNYSIQDKGAPRAKAFEQAMKDAWQKAAIIANANGTNNLTLEHVEESFAYGVEETSDNTIDLTKQTSDLFSPGQFQVSANITATFRAKLTETK